MAIYGRDFYGLSKYGADVYTDYDISPFSAEPYGYGSISVTWHSPSGSWTGIRLLRSRNGYAVDENDGIIVVDAENSVDHFLDTGLAGGFWYYYTIFVQDSTGTWNRAGAVSSLAVKQPWTRIDGHIIDPDFYDANLVPYGYADLLWERIPHYFRYLRSEKSAAITDSYYLDPSATTAYVSNPDQFDEENQHLKRFVGVLGWGLDYLANYQQTVLWANDPKHAHISDVERLAEEMGIDFEFGIPASVMRSKVQNAAMLARRRGTIDGLRDVAALSTGWDVDIQVNQNLFLNRDQSEFANPVYNEWDPGVNYAVGQKVQYIGRIMTCTVGAYGNAQKPPTSPTTSNTWWTVTTDTDVTTLTDPALDAVVTWKGWQDGTTKQILKLSNGVSDPFDSTTAESNSLAIRNSTGSAHTYDVVGASNAASDTTDVLPKPQYVITQGIPIPRVLLWDPTIEYDLGQYVQHFGATWKSVGTSLNAPPSLTSPYWQKVGIDARPLLAYSFYAHGPLTGTAGTGGVAVTPGVAYYDDKGNLIADKTSITVQSNFFFDTFNNEVGTLFTSRDPDFTWTGPVKWVTASGTWAVDGFSNNDERVAYPTTSTGATTVTVPGTLTAYRVAATFFKAPAAGLTDSLAIRYVDANNYMRVTRTKVQKRVAGTLSDVVTLSQTIVDGDRVWVKIDDSANTFTVYRNGTSVGTGSLSGGTSPYKHGMMVE